MDFIQLKKPISDNHVHQTWELGIEIDDIIDNGINQYQLMYIGSIMTVWYKNPKQRDGTIDELAVNLNLKNDIWFKIKDWVYIE